MGKRRTNDDLIVAAVVALTIGLVIGLFKLIGHIISGLSSSNEREHKQALALLCGLGVIAGAIAVTAIVAGQDNSDFSNPAPISDHAASVPAVDRGDELKREASGCVERADWDCAESKLAEAERFGASTTTERARVASLLISDAEASYTAAKKARGKERKALFQQAASALQRAKIFDPTISNDRGALQLAAKIKRADARPKRVKATDETDQASNLDYTVRTEPVASATEANTDVADPSRNASVDPQRVPSQQGCAENGSCYGDISTATGRPKTVEVRGYYRKDGTYVRGHYRSRGR